MDALPKTVTPAASADLFCPFCGYNLRGTPGATRCPECGHAVDVAALRRSTIPWEARLSIGRVRAFRQTVWLVTRRPQELARHMNAPLVAADAERFRRVVAAIVWVTLMAVGGMLYAFDRDWRGPLIGRGWDLLTGAVACGLFAVFITGVHGYWFEPRGMPAEERDRALMLSTYACGVLAWLPVPALLAGVVYGLALLVPAYRAAFPPVALQVAVFLAEALAGLLAALIPLRFWLTIVRLHAQVTHRSVARTWLLAVLLPLEWLGVALLTLVLIPVGAFALDVFVLSLR